MRTVVKLLIGAALVTSAAPAAAQTMSVATFVGKATALKKKGPLALFSGDIKLLINQVKADSSRLRAENQAFEAAGKPKHYCTPDGFKMSDDTILAAMQEVPATEQAKTSTKEALRAYIARRHPCRG